MNIFRKSTFCLLPLALALGVSTGYAQIAHHLKNAPMTFSLTLPFCVDKGIALQLNPPPEKIDVKFYTANDPADGVIASTTIKDSTTGLSRNFMGVIFRYNSQQKVNDFLSSLRQQGGYVFCITDFSDSGKLCVSSADPNVPTRGLTMCK